MSPIFFPTTIAELFGLLGSNPNVMLMAGGTDLLVTLRYAPLHTGAIICLERIAELSLIEEQPDGSVSIGAGVSLSRITSSPLLQQRYPLLTQAASTVGGPAIRTMATIGGNLASASPAGDSLPALYLLDAAVELCAKTARRTVAISDFITGPRQTALQPGECISRIILPPAPDWTFQRFEKVGRRKSLAIAVASLAAMLRLADDGTVLGARLAWGSVGPVVMRCREAEETLIGKPLSEAVLHTAAALARQAVRPISDIRATAEYRRTVAGNLLLRLLEQ